MPRSGDTVAQALQPLLTLLFGPRLPVRFEFWDGSASGPIDGPGTIVVRSPDAVRRMAWAPGELGLSRAYVAGDIDVEGDIFAVPRVLRDAPAVDLRTQGVGLLPALLPGARRFGLFRPPPRPPREEATLTWGRLHSPRRMRRSPTITTPGMRSTGSSSDRP